MTALDTLLATLLYEGYVLWPYRRSALKNRQRWTFGGVYPRAYSEAASGVDRWRVRTETLVRGRSPVVDVEVRYLHVLDRLVALLGPDGRERFVDDAAVGPARYLRWEEATERRVSIAAVPSGSSRRVTLDVPADEEREHLGPTNDGADDASLVRCWSALEGDLAVVVDTVGPDLHRVRVDVTNTSDDPTRDREAAIRHAFVAANVVLRARDGAFVSVLDPPADSRREIAACTNDGLFPVLVGPEGASDTVLASPIILYDHPRIATESPGDTFDATEIDQMLVLNLLALTDEEKAEIRATDPRTATLLDRTEGLTPATMGALNGAVREFRELAPDGRWDSPWPALPTAEADDALALQDLDRPGPTSIAVRGGILRPGSRVILRPLAGRDAFDLLLAGRIGVVESIETDFEGTSHVAITIEDDPGRDLGLARMPGHRFFMAPDEVEPVGAAAEAAR